MSNSWSAAGSRACLKTARRQWGRCQEIRRPSGRPVRFNLRLWRVRGRGRLAPQPAVLWLSDWLRRLSAAAPLLVPPIDSCVIASIKKYSLPQIPPKLARRRRRRCRRAVPLICCWRLEARPQDPHLAAPTANAVARKISHTDAATADLDSRLAGGGSPDRRCRVGGSSQLCSIRTCGASGRPAARHQLQAGGRLRGLHFAADAL